MADFRALCQELMDAIDSGIPVERIKQSPLAVRAEAALAQPEPQWPTDEPLGDLIDKWVQEAFSKKPHGCKHPTHVYVACKAYECGRSHAARTALAQPEPQGPTDEELMELMPESMRDEFSYAARVCSDAMGRRVKAGIFRVALNTAALEYARAVLDRWGQDQQNKETIND